MGEVVKHCEACSWDCFAPRFQKFGLTHLHSYAKEDDGLERYGRASEYVCPLVSYDDFIWLILHNNIGIIQFLLVPQFVMMPLDQNDLLVADLLPDITGSQCY